MKEKETIVTGSHHRRRSLSFLVIAGGLCFKWGWFHACPYRYHFIDHVIKTNLNVVFFLLVFMFLSNSTRRGRLFMTSLRFENSYIMTTIPRRLPAIRSKCCGVGGGSGWVFYTVYYIK